MAEGSNGQNGEGGAPVPEPRQSQNHRGRNAVIVVCVAVLWIALDQVSKQFFNSGAFDVGQHIAGPFLGLFRLTLVHNTGAAWGMLGDSTGLLAVVSLAVCALFLAYLFLLAPNAGIVQTVGLALVVAGGLGNAIDRFTQGYVTDFIDFAFIDFPVFNVADIGVTCGFVLFIGALAGELLTQGKGGKA